MPALKQARAAKKNKVSAKRVVLATGRDVLFVGRLRGKILGFVSEAGVGGKMWEEAG